jgi:hypothetical protein
MPPSYKTAADRERDRPAATRALPMALDEHSDDVVSAPRHDILALPHFG